MSSSTKPLLVIGVTAVVIAVPIYHTVREWSRVAPHRRPWLLAAAIGALILVAVIVPHIGKLRPPFSESPAGIFVILARAIPLGLIALAAVATLVAVATPPAPDRADPAALP
jgi:hypothetical protein